MKHRAYKFRFYPTDEQAKLLAQTFGCVRFVYNTILRWRFAFLNDVSCVPTQQALRHQQTAFKNFFEGRTKYPTFKKKTHKQIVIFLKE